MTIRVKMAGTGRWLSAVLVFFCTLSVCAENGEDPLRTEYLKELNLWEQEVTNAKLINGEAFSEQQKQAMRVWLQAGSRRAYWRGIALREFFSGPLGARGESGTLSAAKVLDADQSYIIDCVRFGNDVILTEESGVKGKEGSIPKWAETALGAVTVFVDADGAAPRDLASLSLALLPQQRPGAARPLRSEGPYARYLVTLKIEDEKERAVVVACEKDETFDSDKFVKEITQERIESFLRWSSSGPAENKTSALPGGADVLMPDKMAFCRIDWEDEVHLGEKGKAPEGPWACSLLIRRDASHDVHERYAVSLRYDWRKDKVSVVSSVQDEAFTKAATQRLRIAQFVAKYLADGPEYRRGVVAPGVESKLLAEGVITIQGRLTYENVSRSPDKDGIWTCECLILHSGGFGRDWHRAARFSCKVRLDEQGRLRVVEDAWFF